MFEAARLLKDEADIGFLLSGWGIGFERLKQLQADAKLPNVAFVARVEDSELEAFLTAGRPLDHPLPEGRGRGVGAEPLL